mmetsp:Transcript_13008/g.26393  ORF Transcript_13008/g.26393 Transcript_13008/m.26393 type:complete len:504 (+) Transcript_13008:104-1615(+)
MPQVSLLPRIESLPEDMSNQEDELERMLEEAERLAAQMRIAAIASNAHFESSQGGATMNHRHNSDSKIDLEPMDDSQESEQDAAVDLPQRQPPPPKHPPTRHAPRQASGSTIDTGVPVSTVQIPPQPPSVTDDLSLPSNIHIVHAGEGGGGKSVAEVEAAIRATQNMERALHALGATTLEEEEPTSPVPDSPPTVSRKTSPATLHREFAEATSAASSSHNKRKKKQGGNSADAPSTFTKDTPKPPPPTISTNGTIPPPPSSSSSILPREGDSDYVPLKDYSFKPSKFTPDDSVTWEQVDTPEEHDDDFVPLKDYSNLAPVTSSRTAVASVSSRRGGSKKRRRRRFVLVAVVMSLALLGFAYYLMQKAAQPPTSATTRTTVVPEREPVDLPPAPPKEPIQIEPLPWIAEEDASEAEDVAEEMDLEQAFSNYFNPPTADEIKEEEQQVEEEEDEEEEDEFGHYIDIEPARGFLCNLPTGWLLFGERCHSSSRKERIDSLLNAMLL